MLDLNNFLIEYLKCLKKSHSLILNDDSRYKYFNFYFNLNKMTLIYKLDRAPPVVQQVLEQLGWIEHDPSLHASYEWNLFWKTGRY